MKKRRSSKYCLVCRNLVFSMAQDIGPKTLEVVQKLYYSGISVYDSYKMDFLIFSHIFRHFKGSVGYATEPFLLKKGYCEPGFSGFFTAFIWNFMRELRIK